MKRLLLAGLLAAHLANLTKAADVAGEYIVELAGPPAVTVSPAKSPRLAASRSNVRAAQASVRVALAAADVDVVTSTDTVMNALIVRSGDPEQLRRTPGVARVYPVRLYKMTLDRARVLHKLPEAAALLGGEENAGAGTRIAIIDSGIDISHPAFTDAGFSMPDGFPRVNKDTDIPFTNSKVIVARNYDTRVSSTAADRKGHGTAVAMIAAGNLNAGPKATISGIAPGAWLGSYKVFPDNQEGAPTSNILKAIDDAVADGMDVINLSLGAFPAERLDSDPLAIAVENAARAGVIVVVAAGNDGPGLNSISSPATAPSAITVGSSFNDRVFASSAWLDGLDPFLAVPGDASRGGEPVRGQITFIGALDPTGLACSELPAGSLSGKVALILRGTCLFEEKINIAQRAGAIAAVIYTHADQPNAEIMATGSARLPAVMISNQDGLKARERLQSGDAGIVIDFSENAVHVDSERLAGFTSKGPSVDSSIKPDLVAIGTSVYTARPGGYSTVQGTSFSAPIVAGAAAMIKAFRPGLSIDQYKSLLTNSTPAFLIKGETVPLQQTGSGLLDVGSTVRSTLTANPSALSFGAGGSTIDKTRVFVLKNVGTVADTFSISASALPDGAVSFVSPDVIELSPGASAEVSVRFSGFDLPPHSYQGFLSIRGTQTEVTTRLPYWYAVTDGVVNTITVVEAPEQGRPSSTQEFYVRALDQAGVPLQSEPKVTLVSDGAGARVNSVESVDSRYPGFYQVRVRLSSQPGENIFEIDAGGVTARVTIAGS